MYDYFLFLIVAGVVCVGTAICYFFKTGHDAHVEHKTKTCGSE